MNSNILFQKNIVSFINYVKNDRMLLAPALFVVAAVVLAPYGETNQFIVSEENKSGTIQFDEIAGDSNPHDVDYFVSLVAGTVYSDDNALYAWSVLDYILSAGLPGYAFAQTPDTFTAILNSTVTSTVSDVSVPFIVTFSETINPDSFTSTDIDHSSGSVANLTVKSNGQSAAFDIIGASSGTLTVSIISGGITTSGGSTNTASTLVSVEITSSVLSDPVTGTLTVVSYMHDDVNGFSDLATPRNAVVFQIGSNTYTAITAEDDNSVQLADITDPANPVAIAYVRDSDTRELAGSSGIDIFEIDGKTYVIVTAMVDDGIQIIDVTNPYDPVAAGYVEDTAHTSLSDPIAVDTFVIDGGTYAAVTSVDDNAFQIIDVTDPINPVPAGRILDNANLRLNAPYGVEVFEADGNTYAIVAAYQSVGIQIINVTDPYAPTVAGNVGDNSIHKLYHSIDVSVFEAGGDNYAIVAGYQDRGVQVINITSPYNPILAGSITDIGVATQIDTFEAGGNPYAVFTEYDINQIRLVDLSDPDNPIKMASVKSLESSFSALGVEIFETGGSLYAITTDLRSKSASITRIDMTVDRPPGLVINQMQFISIPTGSSYTDAGAICIDETDGDITDQIQVTSTVNTAVPEDYIVTYTCVDSAGNYVVATRTVAVVDTTALITLPIGAPTITVLGAMPVNVNVGNDYADAGATCTDETDGDLTHYLRTTSDVNVYTHGNYTVTYECTDLDDNRTVTTRTVMVIDTDIPQITLSDYSMFELYMDGSPYYSLLSQITLSDHSMFELYVGDIYTDAGAICIDRVEGDLSDTMTVISNVDTAIVGQYTVTYSCADSIGNEAVPVSRTVVVLDLVPMIIDGVGGFTELGGASSVAVFEQNNSTYAIITARYDNGIQIINITDPANPTATSSISDDDTLKLYGASDVAVFEQNNSTYAIITARYDDGIQIINITDPANPTAEGHASDGKPYRLGGASSVAVFEQNNSTYAIITAYDDDGIQIINITDPANPTAEGHASDGKPYRLGGASDVAVFEQNNSTYAIITAYDDDGIQIINITDPANPTAEGHASDGKPYRLGGASDVAVFEKDNSTYALVTAFYDNTVQIIDITNPSHPIPTGHKKFGKNYVGLSGVTTFVDDNSIYAIVTQNMRDGIRIMNITDFSNLVTKQVIYDSAILNLDDSTDVTTFKSGDSIYAIVTAYGGNGAQIIPVFIKTYTPPTITAVRNVMVTEAQPPEFLSAVYMVDSDKITMTFSEPLNSTAHLDRLHIRDIGQSSDGATLSGVSELLVSGSTVNVTLAASQVAIIDSLTTPQLDIDHDAVFDLTGNGIITIPDQPITIDTSNSHPSTISYLEYSVVVLEPTEPRDSRDIGRITLSGIQPGTIQASWEAPTETPLDYRISWAKTGDSFLTWTDLSGNAFPTTSTHTISDLDEGEEYKVQMRARYDGTSGDWSGKATITVITSPAFTPLTVYAVTITLEPSQPLGSRDIGTITLTSSESGKIVASWEAPTETPLDYRISWAKTGDSFLTWTDLSGNAFPTTSTHTISDLDEGEEYKVQMRARYDGTSGDWSDEITITTVN